MSNGSIDFKFNEGNRTISINMTGYGEETSLLLMKEVLKAVHSNPVIQEKEEIAAVEKSEYNQGLKLVENKIEIPELHDSPQDEFIEEDLYTEEDLTPPDEVLNEVNEEVHEHEDPFNPDNESYQAYYICKCGDRGKHKIKRSQIYLNCWKCGKRMRVRDASINGFPYKDDYGNTFIAGEFRRSDELKYGAMI